MIVDCHTHIWQSPDQLGPADLGEPNRSLRARGVKSTPGGKVLRRSIPAADPDHHWHEQEEASIDTSIVLGVKRR